MNTALPLWQFSLQAWHALAWIGLLLVICIWSLRTPWINLIRLVVFLIFDLIVLGAYVRLTDAGLGCPDWPGCYGKLTPIHATADIDAAVAIQGGEYGPVSSGKAWREMLHRYLASMIGALILVLAIRSVWHCKKHIAAPRVLPWVLLCAVILQGLFGKWTVTLLLTPAIVTIHLMLGMFLLILSVWLWQRNQALVEHTQHHQTPLLLSQRFIYFAYICFVALLMQIALGAWVSSNYAALACIDFPQCQGDSWMPAMDFTSGFTFWRPLGQLPDGSAITMAALQAIVWVHRHFAYLVAILTVLLCVWLWRKQQRFWSYLLGSLITIQMVLGILNVLWSLPLLIALSHLAVAALLVISYTFMLSKVRLSSS